MTERGLTTSQVRAALSRNAIAADAAVVASSITGHVVEIVVLEEGRSFLAASSSPDRILTPRPMTTGEASIAAASSRSKGPVSADDGVAVPIVIGGRAVASLTVRGPVASTDALVPLARMVGSCLRSTATSASPDQRRFAEKVLDGLRDSVLVVSHDFDILYANPGTISLLGFTPGELVGRSAADFVHGTDLEVAIDAVARMAQGLEMDRLRLRLRTASGEFLAVEITGTDMGGDALVNGLVLSVRDANAETELSVAVDRSRRVSDAIVHRLTDGILALDRFGAVTLANGVAKEMLRIPADLPPSEIDLSIDTFFTPSGEPLDLMADTDGAVRGLLPTNGDVRYVDVVSRPVSGGDGDELGRVVVLTDVTDAHLAAEHLREQALHDQLTGLANRRQLDQVLAAVEGAADRAPLAVAFIDLDGFKLVNDNHGHRVGDQVIRLAARRLAASLRAEDLLVRQGGDEFVALLSNCESITKATESGERLRAALAEPYLIGGERFDLSASIGVAVGSTDETSADVLLRQADIALYEAKRSGRDRVEAFDESLAESVRNEERHRRVLRSALDDDRVVMHFQPLVDSGTEEIRGYEALARIVTVDGDLLTPSQFMDAIAHTGMMWDLDRAAYRLSCNGARLLTTVSDGAAPYVACNFSSVSLTHPDFVDFVIATTDDAGVPRERICIELTESAAFDSGSRSASALARLQAEGFRLALDDFGTGYSSLAHLRDLPIDAVKVDRSFVARLTEDGSERAIAEAVVALARDLDLGIVAEGVETEEQLDRARDLGFATIQGWHFAPALPLERCLEQWRSSETASAV